MSPVAALYRRVAGVLAVLLIAGGALFGAYLHGESVADARWSAKQADEQLLQAKAQAAATQTNHAEERRRQVAADEVENEGASRAAKNQADAALSARAAAGLRKQAAKLASAGIELSGNSATSDQCAATRRASLVLSQLLDRSVETNRELAADRDAARDAGLTCERAYNAVRGQGSDLSNK